MGFDLVGKLGLNNEPFDKNLKKAEESVAKTSDKMAHSLQGALSGDFFGKLFGGFAAGVGLGAITSFAKEIATSLEGELKEIKIGSILTQMDPETFQRVRNVVEATGSSIEKVAKAQEKIAEGVEAFKSGSKEGYEMARNMMTLGASLQAIKDGDFQKVFFQIADSLKTADIDAQRLAAMKDVLGRGGLELLPAFKRGFDNPSASFGIIDEKELKRLNEVVRLSKEAGGIWKDVGHTIGATFMKVFSGFKLMPMIFQGRNFRASGLSEEEEATAQVRGAQQGFAEELARKDKERAERELAAREAQQKADEAETKHQQDRRKKISDLNMRVPAMEAEALNEGSPRQKKIADLRMRIRASEEGVAKFRDRLRANKDDEDAQVNSLLFREELAGQKKHLAQLLNQKPDRRRQQNLDSLASIGGFSQNQGTSANALNEIKKNTRDAVQRLDQLNKSLN